MQARWQLSDALMGKKVTVEGESEVFMYIPQCKMLSKVSLDFSFPA